MAHIVICADGTWNRPEEDLENDFPTNVLQLARAVKPDAGEVRQHVFYDWGLGSYHSNISAGVSGVGIHKNILDGYRYIVQNFAPGDSIYLFGFSRGAYTVRALSGLINNCGIIKREDARLITQAWKIYKSPTKTNHPAGSAARTFRARYTHPSRGVHFIGVWDTVGALGIPLASWACSKATMSSTTPRWEPMCPLPATLWRLMKNVKISSPPSGRPGKA